MPNHPRGVVVRDSWWQHTGARAGDDLAQRAERTARSYVVAIKRDIPAGQEPFESKIIRKYQRRSDTIDETFMKLFIEGLATRDFEPALRLLTGEKAPLSPSMISRLTQKFKAQYAMFEQQKLDDRTFVYIWSGGICLKAGLGTEKACLMVLIGANTEGKKHLIALREGYRENADSWGGLIKDSFRRRLNRPAWHRLALRRLAGVAEFPGVRAGRA